MKHVAHGATFIGWMVEFDAKETDRKAIWNEAAEVLNSSESQVMEQTNRITTVHPADHRCGLCPKDIQSMSPDEMEKVKSTLANEDKKPE